MAKKNLKNYLEELRKCNDPIKLDKEFCVWDNYPILVHGQPDRLFEMFRKDLEESVNSSENFIQKYHLKEIAWDSRNYYRYNLEAGTVLIQITKQKKERDFIDAICITLHPYQEKKIEGVDRLQAISLVIQDIGNYVLKKNLPASFACRTLRICS